VNAMPSRVLIALLALLALAAPSVASAASRPQILRDCEDDSRLSKTYKPSELRDARANIPSDKAIYTDCSSVLRSALAASARRRAGASGAGGGGGGAGASDPGTAPVLPDASTGSSESAGSGVDLNALDTQAGADRTPVASADDLKALRSIRENLPEVDVRGQRVVPGIRGVAGQAATATVPPSLVLALGLLGLTAVLALVALVRRRVLAHRAE